MSQSASTDLEVGVGVPGKDGAGAAATNISAMTELEQKLKSIEEQIAEHESTHPNKSKLHVWKHYIKVYVPEDWLFYAKALIGYLVLLCGNDIFTSNTSSGSNDSGAVNIDFTSDAFTQPRWPDDFFKVAQWWRLFTWTMEYNYSFRICVLVFTPILCLLPLFLPLIMLHYQTCGFKNVKLSAENKYRLISWHHFISFKASHCCFIKFG